MSIPVIVQARMASTRLPGKVLRSVAGRPLLSYLVDRLQRVRLADMLLIATTVSDTDLPIVDFCTQHQLPVFRGSEEDVLQRYREAAESVEAHAVVRVTADCPVIDPAIVDNAIQLFLNARDADYVSNTIERTYPRGMDVEVFTFDALREADAMAVRAHEREHVTPFIYQHTERYTLKHLTQDSPDEDWRWTVDTPEDFCLIAKMIEELGGHTGRFNLSEMRAFMLRRPELAALNGHIRQKELQG